MLKPNDQERRALLDAWKEGRTADCMSMLAAIATWKPQTFEERIAAIAKKDDQSAR